MVKNKKAKGSTLEREVLHAFWETGTWGAVRVAGSGSTSRPSVDLVAGNGKRLLAIECKASAADNEYISREQIDELKEVAMKMGAEPWICVKYDRKKWLFLTPFELKEADKNLVAVRVLAETIGRTFEELIK